MSPQHSRQSSSSSGQYTAPSATTTDNSTIPTESSTESPATTLSSPTISPTTSFDSFAATQTVSPTAATSTAAAATDSTHLNDGAIAGGVVGGTIFLALLILGTILFCRARRRKHIAPSSEFVETIKRGEMPVLRLDCGVEIIPTDHQVPLPLRQNTYHTSPPMSDMKFPDGMMWSEAQSARYSLQKPLQPLRYPVHQDSDDSMRQEAPMGSSIENSQEYSSHESRTRNIEPRREFVSQSPPSPTDPGYLPLMQNTYPMGHSHAVETVQNAYADLWQLSVAPTTQSRRASARDAEAPLPPLVPVRRRATVDVQALPPLVPVRRSVDVGQR
ncbi:hypothetical protein K503DRAFT_29655 [Rhizopogon vinicolor AM-OR11-026]|uniref:Uncharacterized protein n=1 Tax=Rhizopogon vinicolor AM-OR11-026 TaxID=1314800 RepID=A0A1B7N586_9AGAM|nr:hypothetical protein K503DRAFT_29655 [Rhizopogon vinicolor AM-OR11-026]